MRMIKPLLPAVNPGVGSRGGGECRLLAHGCACGGQGWAALLGPGLYLRGGEQ